MDFNDRRRRVIIELEAAGDVIKYVQGLGRANRFGQVSAPRMTTIVAGLAPELRLMQQRNRKLRRMGASVDANRAHPYLARNVPDLLNRVGDEATLRVLTSDPGWAERLGLSDYLPERFDDDGMDEDVNNVLEKALRDNLTNKVLARLVVLQPEEQRDMMARVESEFQALVAELNSRNMNPLVIRTVPGRFETKAATLFTGVEREGEEDFSSSFTDAVWLETGLQHLDQDALPLSRVLEIIERARMETPSGFRQYANRLEQIKPALLLDQAGQRIEDALDNPEGAGERFWRLYNRYNRMRGFLEDLKPGVWLRSGANEKDILPQIDGVVTRVILPARASDAMVSSPSSYAVEVLTPGGEKSARYTVSSLLRYDTLTVDPGFSEGVPDGARAAFERAAVMARRRPQQFMTGNLLSAIRTANYHRLGAVVAVADQEGKTRRGVMVHESKVDLTQLPVHVPDPETGLALVAAKGAAGRAMHPLTFWSGRRAMWESHMRVRVMEARPADGEPFDNAIITVPGRSAKNAKWWREREGLHETLFRGQPFRPVRHEGEFTIKVLLEPGPEKEEAYSGWRKLEGALGFMAADGINVASRHRDMAQAAQACVRTARRAGAGPFGWYDEVRERARLVVAGVSQEEERPAGNQTRHAAAAEREQRVADAIERRGVEHGAGGREAPVPAPDRPAAPRARPEPVAAPRDIVLPDDMGDVLDVA